MPRFSILPADERHQPVDVDGIDGASALNATARLSCREAHVLVEGIYRFSIRKWGVEGIFWEIFQRENMHPA